VDASRLIRSWRRQQGLSQAELAERIGVDQSYISSYESARRSPGLGVLQRIAGGLGGELRLALQPRPGAMGWVPLTLAALGEHLAGEVDIERRRRLVLEFVTGYGAMDLHSRPSLVSSRPDLDTGPWAALLAGFAEHCAFWDEFEPPIWSCEPARFLSRAWYLVDGARMRRRARLGSPAAFARRLVFLDPADLERV
jgi:transcriptional regulator with XRE-family HTH domain